MELLPVDPHDERAFAQWFAVLDACAQHDRPGQPDWLLREHRQLALQGAEPGTDTRRVLLAAREGAAVVGALRLDLPQRDNLHLCELVLCVLPAARRRGVGRALAAEADRRARALGRSTLLTCGDEPPGRPPTNRLAGVALGYEVVQQEVRRDIDLPLDPDRVARLERACRPYARDYAVRTWWDRCPDELADDCAALHAAMSTDVPKDRMDWREEVWDAARLRRDEQLSAAMDRSHVGGGAVHLPTGRMVAFTTMGVPRSQPRRAYQWETLVAREHRGHRLGTLVKLAALQELAAASPSTGWISTWNARENAPMIAVNDALGARTNGCLTILQRTLPGPA